ncbi:hypothetical protein WG66_014631 [Moniliophthora roreri]|nr:hypothetical protein WG66_014631 [Moniliophthora roreri]
MVAERILENGIHCRSHTDAAYPGPPASLIRNSLDQSPPDPPRASYSSTSSDIASATIPDVHGSSQELVPLRTLTSDSTRSEEILASYFGERPSMLHATLNPPHAPHKRGGTFNNALEQLNHWCQLNGRRAIWTHQRTGPGHQSEWESIVQVNETRSVGRASQKQESKQKAAAEFLETIAMR